MSTRVLEAMVRQLLELGFSPAMFSWQGGEPTLAGLDFYRQVVSAQSRFGRPGQVVGNSFQTNGLLLDDEWGEFLARYRFFVGLSLDGPRGIHDAYRTGADGSGSFKETFRAISVLRRHGVEFNILSVLTPETTGKAKELYEFFAGEGLTYLQFIPSVERQPGGENPPFNVTPEGYGRFLCDLFDLWQADGHRVSIRHFDAILERLISGVSPLCIFGKRCDSYVVVESNGDVYPCDFFVYHRWRLGNLGKTHLAELSISEKRREFASMKSRLAERCGDCEWVEWCQGGCMKDRLFAGDPNRTPTYLCDAYRRFFAHAAEDFRRLAREIAEKQGLRLQSDAY